MQSEHDEPGWLIGTITNMIQQCKKWFRQKQMKLDEPTQAEWETTATYFRESDNK
jgi:hypothetical protein